LLSGETARGLDEYSKKIHALYDKIWQEEYQKFIEKDSKKFQESIQRN